MNGLVWSDDPNLLLCWTRRTEPKNQSRRGCAACGVIMRFVSVFSVRDLATLQNPVPVRKKANSEIVQFFARNFGYYHQKYDMESMDSIF
jgi:hypothetical protein